MSLQTKISMEKNKQKQTICKKMMNKRNFLSVIKNFKRTLIKYLTISTKKTFKLAF